MKTSAWKTRSSCFAGFALALTCLSGPGRAQEKSDLRLEGRPLTRYIVTDLGPIGPPPAQPFALSASGFVSGEVVLAGGTVSVSHAVIWKGRSMTDISSPGMGGPNSAAFGVNVWGQAVGQADTSTPDPKGENFCGSSALGLTHSGNTCVPFLFQEAAMSALPLLSDSAGASGNNGQAWQINRFGVAAGSSENTTADSTCPGPPSSAQVYEFKPVVWFRLFPWSQPVVQALPTVADDPDGVAFAVNEKGEAAGGTGSCGPFNTIALTNLVPLHAVLWQHGKPIDLGNLGGDGHFGGIYATGLNDVRQVVGVSDTTGDASFHGFLWQDGHMSDLQPLAGDSYSYATAISDKGLVLGLSLDANFNLRAALWENGKPIDLNTLVPEDTTLDLQTACSINKEGQITGIALAKGTASDYHAYLATPILGNVDHVDSDSATTGVEGTSKENAKTLQQRRFGGLASQRSRTE
jgi:probable HAF family extracellular repeat protein